MGSYHREYGVRTMVRLGIHSHPHALITGASGSGKSTTLLWLIGKLLQADSNIVIFLCDFKRSEDFSFFQPYTNYYSGNDCYDGIMRFYELFSAIRENGSAGTRYLLIFDEYPAFLNYLQMQDKQNKTKKANDILGAVAEILMLGRGTGNGFGVWIVTQRPDSNLFASGSRDNFMVVLALGRLSKEQKGMVFAGEDIPDRIFKVGEGMLLADGREIIEVKYPIITDIGTWKRNVLAILMRSGGACATREA